MEELGTLKTAEPVKSSGYTLLNNVKKLSEKTMQNAKDSTEKVFYEIKTLEKNTNISNLFLVIRYSLLYYYYLFYL